MSLFKARKELLDAPALGYNGLHFLPITTDCLTVCGAPQVCRSSRSGIVFNDSKSVLGMNIVIDFADFRRDRWRGRRDGRRALVVYRCSTVSFTIRPMCTGRFIGKTNLLDDSLDLESILSLSRQELLLPLSSSGTVIWSPDDHS